MAAVATMRCALMHYERTPRFRTSTLDVPASASGSGATQFAGASCIRWSPVLFPAQFFANYVMGCREESCIFLG